MTSSDIPDYHALHWNGTKPKTHHSWFPWDPGGWSGANPKFYGEVDEHEAAGSSDGSIKFGVMPELFTLVSMPSPLRVLPTYTGNQI